MIVDLDRVCGEEGKISAIEAVRIRDFFGGEKEINCRIEIAISKAGDTFHLLANVLGTLATFCHKCLEPMDFELETSFQTVVQRGGAEGTEDLDLAGEEYVHLPVGEHRISLDQQIYESVIVSIPMQILCREDCQGLCPKCGANLNNEACSCAKNIDLRWDALKKMKGRFAP